MKEYIIGVPDDEPLSSLRRYGKTITAIAKITGNCDEVIRCKDCKWYEMSEGETYCRELGIFDTDPTSYCSYAKRAKE